MKEPREGFSPTQPTQLHPAPGSREAAESFSCHCFSPRNSTAAHPRQELRQIIVFHSHTGADTWCGYEVSPLTSVGEPSYAPAGGYVAKAIVAL